MTQSTTETVSLFLEKILQSVHPMMAEGIYLAAVPLWYNEALFSAMRNRDDGRNQGLVERLTRYSFISRLGVDEDSEQTYAVRPEERMLIQRYWILKDPEAYRTAHQQALAYWESNPDPNPFAQAQNQLYHQLFVDLTAATDFLIDRFRAYHNERQLTAIDRLLNTVEEARFYLVLLDGQSPAGLGNLTTHLQARLSQLRGNWDKSLESLQKLRQKEGVPPELHAYVTRAYGYALARTGDYVGAIAEYQIALDAFSEQSAATEEPSTLEAERAQTMIALGDAHVGLAMSVRGPIDREGNAWDRLRPLTHFFSFILSLSLILYLSFYLGRRVWHPRFWPTVYGLDWIIARLFAKGARYYSQADPILEKYGAPGEGVAADEKLAALYLAMGDAQQGRTQFSRLLQGEAAPLGEYRQAVIHTGFGQALLRQGHFNAAREHLEQALPVLHQYEDMSHEASACGALAETLFALDDKVEAVNQFGHAAQLYQSQEDWVGATEVVERMEALLAPTAGDENVMEAATAVSRKLPHRQYAAQFRHPLLIQFRRITLMLLPFILLLMPLLIIRLDSGISLTPSIEFKAAPLFDPAEVVSSQLSQGVTTANAALTTDTAVILRWAILLFFGYILLSLLLGLVLIVFTPLRTVQERGRAATVHLEDEGILVAGHQIRWGDVTELVKGDLRLWQRPLPNESAFALAAGEERVVIQGNTNWYTSLRRRVEHLLPPTTQTSDLDYAILGSKLGRLYIANIVFLLLLALLASVLPDQLWTDFPGLPYSIADLYPYFYLGLVLLPTWWLAIRPLHTQRRLNPKSRFPWWMLGSGLLLALFQGITLFRPLLTSVNLYPPLVTLMILIGAGWTIWQAKENGQVVYPSWVRGGTAVLVTVVSILMTLLILREVGSYHYLVLGNTRRDRAQQMKDETNQEELLSGAVHAYGQAINIGGTPLLGIDVRTATRIPLGIPEPHSFTWLSALTNRSALLVQLGRYPEAIGSYSVILKYTDRPAEVHAWRAITRQSWNTTDTGDGELETVQNQYELALADFDKAIQLEPDHAVFHLWRGVAYHALNDLELAENDYETARALTGKATIPLTASERERSLTGQGWIAYSRDSFTEAQQLFEQATQANPKEAEAWVGLGYTAFSQDMFEDAAVSWRHAFALDPDDPAVLISLGTLHWKLGGLTDDAASKCSEYSQSTDFFTQATAVPRQDQKAVAFTYRTRGQLQYLLRNCPGYDVIEQYQATIASYDQALKLDPDNGKFFQKRGRFKYALWLNLPDTPENEAVLYAALADITEAYSRGLRDNTTLRFRTAILNTLEPRALAKGVEFLAAGEFEAAQAEFSLLARSQPEKIDLSFQAGLAALGAGDDEQAAMWVEQGIQAAVETQGGVQLLTTARNDLEAFLKAHPNVDGSRIHLLLTTALENAQAYDPGTLFDEGLNALEEDRTTDALALFQQGLALSADTRYFVPVATAVSNLIILPPDQSEPILSVFRESLPNLAAASGDETDVAAAFELGYTALALNEMETAAFWYNEAIRRTTINNQYPILRASRNTLRQLWDETGVTSTKLLAAMEAHHSAQLETYPDLREDGLYWRFRAWFKYGLGLSAYRLDNETAAATALKSGQADADIAYGLDPSGNEYVQTYLTESAWGWYNVVRGDDAYGAGDYETALGYFASAAQAIRPDRNDDAKGELVTAVFKAAVTSAHLEAFDEAADWLQEGVRLAALFEKEHLITTVRTELEAVVVDRPDMTNEIDALLEMLPRN